MAAPKEIGRKPNGMGECRPLCGCVKTTSWKYHHLFEQILSPANLNRAYKAVMRNRGCGGIDKMSCEQLLPWLLTNKDELIRSLMDGSYRPNPVKRVEIPKDNGKMRLLGIPTVVDLSLIHI